MKVQSFFKMIKKVFFATGLACAGTALFAPEVCAWGAGMHTSLGLNVLDNLALLAPALAAVLRTFSRDFLYGCISADIFIGRGERQRNDHCHNWEAGYKMLSLSKSFQEMAFALGYLSHLAADVIAHNFYIPNQLYTTSTTGKFGHIYWEYRSDILTKIQAWETARYVIRTNSMQCDKVLVSSVKNRGLPFKAKKKIFFCTINLCNLERWQKTVRMLSKSSRWEIQPEYINFLIKMSFHLIVDFLKRGNSALCFEFDPVGTQNLKLAKKMRRIAKKKDGSSPREHYFTIPENILQLAEAQEYSSCRYAASG